MKFESVVRISLRYSFLYILAKTWSSTPTRSNSMLHFTNQKGPVSRDKTNQVTDSDHETTAPADNGVSRLAFFVLRQVQKYTCK